MAQLEMPNALTERIEDPALRGETLRFVAAVSTILADNKTPFFPAYTDHGPEHTW